MGSIDSAPTEGAPSALDDAPALTILADVASQAGLLPAQLDHQPLVPYIHPFTGKKGKALVISKDDARLTPEFVAQFADVLAIDDEAKPLKNSQETVVKWTDDLRRKQAYRGQGYASGIIEVGAVEAWQKAGTVTKEMEEKQTAKEEMEAKKKKITQEELKRKKKVQKEAQNEDARKRKTAKKEAAARRKNFDAKCRSDKDYDVDTAPTADKE